MEVFLASGVGVLAGSGIYLLLRARAFDTVLGLTLISYAVNLLLFFAARSNSGAAPIVSAEAPTSLGHHIDPLPQALVLTAIVIGFAMTGLLIVIVIRMRDATGTDHVDGVEPNSSGDDRKS